MCLTSGSHVHRKCPSDGFLKWISSLLLMDDTVLLSTTRERCTKDIKILTDFCNRSGMVSKQSKTNFMVINGTGEDRAPKRVSDLMVENCTTYTYLGVIFTQYGKVESSVKEHVLSKQKHVTNFAAFVTKNSDFPLWVKRKVLDAAVMSTILYGCESWLESGMNVAQSVYNTALKTLLCVRPTTPNDLVLLELEYPSLQAKVKNIQQKFLSRMLRDRGGIPDDPFYNIWNICKEARTNGALYLQNVLIRMIM